MKPDEIKELAAQIARAIARDQWVPAPVRPQTGAPSAGSLPTWAGAAQALGDVAPSTRGSGSTRYRPAYDAVTVAARAAAAGRGPAPMPGGERSRDRQASRLNVPVAISNRHIHICHGNFVKLFGEGTSPTVDRKITQPGQYAAQERLRVVGPAGAIDNVRIVGPLRDHTQVELAASDCRRIGITAPVRDSGSVGGSAAVRLEGPAGTVELTQGVIMAAAHLHLSPADSQRMGLADGERVSVTLGGGERSATLHDVLVRAGPTHETEIHIDTDEANALGIGTGDLAAIVGRPSPRKAEPPSGNRRLITERDVAGFAARGEQLTDCGAYIVTPAARDRARALGLWRD